MTQHAFDPEWLARRERECPHRDGQSCLLINAELGWRHMCSRETCDDCFSQGIDSEYSVALRRKWIDFAINLVKGRLKGGPLSVVKAYLRHHATEEEKREYKHILDDTVDGRIGWRQVQHTWSKAMSFAKSMKTRFVDGAVAEPRVVNLRVLSCFGVDENNRQVQPPCPSLRQSTRHPGAHWCGDCGCGEREIAMLDRGEYPKLVYPHLECPRRRPGFSNAKV